MMNCLGNSSITKKINLLPQVTATATAGNTAGTCEVDTLVIGTTQGRNRYPTLCGLQTGQHQYIDAGSTANPTDQVIILIM